VPHKSGADPTVCRDYRITRFTPQKLLNVREAIQTSLSMRGPYPAIRIGLGGAVFRDVREVAIPAPAWAAFRAVARLGGRRGWYSADWLWILRGWLDRLAGGPGLRRGRRDPETLGYGEALDFWRVVRFVRNRWLLAGIQRDALQIAASLEAPIAARD
jgi:hypothetical protein